MELFNLSLCKFPRNSSTEIKTKTVERSTLNIREKFFFVPIYYLDEYRSTKTLINFVLIKYFITEHFYSKFITINLILQKFYYFIGWYRNLYFFFRLFTIEFTSESLLMHILYDPEMGCSSCKGSTKISVFKLLFKTFR